MMDALLAPTGEETVKDMTVVAEILTELIRLKP